MTKFKKEEEENSDSLTTITTLFSPPSVIDNDKTSMYRCKITISIRTDHLSIVNHLHAKWERFNFNAEKLAKKKF